MKPRTMSWRERMARRAAPDDAVFNHCAKWSMSMTDNKSADYKWQCTECGYKVDSATCLDDPNARPTDGDLTMCINCGHLYIRHSDKWVEPTAHEYAGLPDEIKSQITRMQEIRAKIVNKDLRKENLS